MASKFAKLIAEKMKDNTIPKAPKPPKRQSAPNAPSQKVKKVHLKDRTTKQVLANKCHALGKSEGRSDHERN